ncbi:hypothetical protein [Streptomyces sp. AC555_RSS877]|uniref:DUF6197 family protein n=1 Tax=Streptomyces sp. AC555_RSS877 TaxID=2823688 RepID=UPI001C256CC6|nr:hypothetical protein [Streptomyces sp. AC555_RSS877]
MTLAEIYLKAAEVIRANGHYKGAYWGRPESGVGVELAAAECPVCTVGALCVATIGDPVPSSDEADPVIVHFASRMFGPTNEAAAVVSIARWNDADDRTPADVIAAFEQAAREVA